MKETLNFDKMEEVIEISYHAVINIEQLHKWIAVSPENRNLKNKYLLLKKV